MKITVKYGSLIKEPSEIAVLGLFEYAPIKGAATMKAQKGRLRPLSPIAKAFDKALGGIITKTLKSGDFKGKLNSTFLLPTYDKLPQRRLLLVGLGKEEDFTIDRLRQVAGTSAKYVKWLGLKRFTSTILPTRTLGTSKEEKTRRDRFLNLSVDRPEGLSLQAQAMVEGTILGLYRFQRFKHPEPEEKEKEVKELTLLVEKGSALGGLEEARQGARKGQIVSEAVCFARDLVNLPSNEATPRMLANTARAMARELGLRVRVLEKGEMKRLGMNGILTVAKGSAQEPQFIILEYGRRLRRTSRGPSEGQALLSSSGATEGQDTVILVGKGVTFDSGGISLKPSADMDRMKYDMAGAATILGAFRALARLRPSSAPSGRRMGRPPVHLVGLLPCAENMPSSTASKPGDIITCLGKKTVEIISTDAEGRMLLADALSYAQRYKPQAVVDLATLTGACVVALGSVAMGMMGTSEELKNRLRAAGEAVWERVWELPLWEEYGEQIKSEIADLKNTGGKEAGAITAASFLSKFIDGYPWAHLDIAGTAWAEKEGPYVTKGATGAGVRLLVEMLTRWERLPVEKAKK
ncbi:MAG: leucyl aminopeptidase [Candidatus Brocadiales bacterium]|nr:leucyl aminopeptidase [Candidatus Brocadiales bacterium]